MELSWRQENLDKFYMQLGRVTLLYSYYGQFITLFTNRYRNRFLPLLWQLFLILNRINKFVELRIQMSPAWIVSGNMIYTW
jgi:hypothetical protein